MKLRCFVVVKLKAVDPEFSGKMNFYLSAVDDLLRHETDNPTIDVLICKKKDSFISEYVLRDINDQNEEKEVNHFARVSKE